MEITTENLLKHNKIRNFIQIGGFDGKTNDPIYEFLKDSSDCFGVILEPQSDIFPRLIENYANQKNIIFLNKAIDWTIGTRKMFSIRKDLKIPEAVYQLSSFNYETIQKNASHVKGLDKYITTIDVECTTMEKLFHDYQLSPIDLIQIDTEGYDYEIIKMIDHLGKWPKILRFESAHLPLEAMEDIYSKLSFNGYKTIREDMDIVAYR